MKKIIFIKLIDGGPDKDQLLDKIAKLMRMRENFLGT